MRLCLIAAVGQNGVIGTGNALPWRLPEDLQYFKKMTLGKPMIMGRKTYESIGKPLPGRTSIVVTSRTDWHPDGVVIVDSLSGGLAIARRIAERDAVDEIMVIGGAQIYQHAMASADRIYLTRVEDSPQGDVFFPQVDARLWCEQRVAAVPAGDGVPAYSFVILDRNSRQSAQSNR